MLGKMYNCIVTHYCASQGFWDAMTLLSQHRRDDTSFTGAPLRTKSVAPTLTKLHAQKLAAQEETAAATPAANADV